MAARGQTGGGSRGGAKQHRGGDNWHKFVLLVQAIWDHGEIPPQLLWVIIVLIPKGGGDYWGIGLLEPMWKVCERVMAYV